MESNPQLVSASPGRSPLVLSSVPVLPFQIATNGQLAHKLGWKSSNLLTMLGKDKSKHYSTLFLKKKGGSGKLRILHNPDGIMRSAQFRILRNILEKIEVPEYVYAFEKNKSIPMMAQAHVNKNIVVSLDLKDFFTSIKQYHLEQLFNHLGITAAAGRTLSELCTYKSFVPQGALTSPKVSNIITALTFGPIIRDYCLSKGLSLTIYADDITISSDAPLDGKDGRVTTHDLIMLVSETVKRFGFQVNSRKTKVMHSYQRQYVCGAVVNQRVNLQKSERHRLRAIVHNCKVNGLVQEAAKSGLAPTKFAEVMVGKLNWFTQLNPGAGERVMSQFKEVVMEQGEPNAVTEAVEDQMTAGGETESVSFTV